MFVGLGIFLYYSRIFFFHFCQEIAIKRQGKLTRGILLLQDNAPAHTSQVDMTASTKCGFEILLHPQYSPDMAPSYFYLFPKFVVHYMEAMKAP